ncbi:hypothetical protein ACIRD2_33565 [Streptomyces sp. NPDC093595]|uniref:hypothetical protein n=1 Tax=Streptomyces sp. NPDC093595 TaxID=3366045 RepID=UPI0038000490
MVDEAVEVVGVGVVGECDDGVAAAVFVVGAVGCPGAGRRGGAAVGDVDLDASGAVCGGSQVQDDGREGVGDGGW